MSSKVKLLIVFSIFLIAAGLTVFLNVRNEHVPDNSPDTIGNLPGNILGGGLFCEVDGTVYFSNTMDSHTLYSMDPDETNIKRLGSMGVSQICGAGKYLYFYMDSSLYSQGKGLGYMGHTFGVFRYRISNGKTTSLARANVQMMQLCGSTLYYSGDAEDGPGLFKVGIKGSDPIRLSASRIQPAAYDGRYLYYAGMNGDPSLYSVNTAFQDIETLVMAGNISQPIPSGDFVYYLDNTQDYHLYRYNKTTGAGEPVCDDRIDFYNTNGRYIWYATSADDRPALKRINMDGSDRIILADGVYNSIHITSKYVYFAPYSKADVTTIYHIPVDSIAGVAQFSPPIGQ